MKSIKTKLMAYFSILILVISGLFGFISIQTTSRAVLDEVDRTLSVMATDGGRLINSRLESEYVYIEGLADKELISDPSVSLQDKLRLLKEIASKRSDFIRLGIVTKDGILHFTDSFEKNATGTDVTTRQYYLDSIIGSRGILPPTVSVNPDDNNAVIMALSTPIYSNNSVAGVLVAVKDANFLNAMSDDMGFGEKGYAYIINPEGTVISHPDRSKVVEQFNPIKAVESDKTLKSIAKQFQTILDEETGVSTYTYQGEELFSAYTNIEGTTWKIVLTANEEEVLSAIPALKRNIILTSIIILLTSIVICYLIGTSITKPIIQSIKHSKKIADLDISQDFPKEFLHRKDEIGTLATAFQSIIDNLREFISHIVDTSELVAASSEELTSTSQQSAQAANEVARTIEEIARGASSQAKETEFGAHSVNELGMCIEQDQSLVGDLNKTLASVDLLKNEGIETIKRLVVTTVENGKVASDVRLVVEETKHSAEKIELASQMIKNIANQTNLLALNAAIEAARAGEAGRGFAVVADEIRKLAEQSNSFTDEIGTVISELSNKVDLAVKTMEHSTIIVKEQTERVNETNVKFEGISDAIEEMKDTINSLNDSGKEMEEKKVQIINVLENLSAISQQNAAGSEEAAASVEEQTASMDEIANTSESLATLAQAMQTEISKFKC